MILFDATLPSFRVSSVVLCAFSVFLCVMWLRVRRTINRMTFPWGRGMLSISVYDVNKGERRCE